MTPFDYRRFGVVLGVAFLLSTALFLLAPEIDLRVAAMFYIPGEGFLLADHAGWTTLRMVSMYASLAFLAIALINAAVGLKRKTDAFGVPTRLWVTVSALYVLGPGLVANLLFKSYSGRARPAHVNEFGGEALFTPAWVFTDQCQTNCSFVSGEGSMATATVISGIMVLTALRHRLGDGFYRFSVTTVVALGVFTAAQRVVTGRHFLSDTVFAFLIVAVIALALHRLLLDREAATQKA